MLSVRADARSHPLSPHQPFVDAGSVTVMQGVSFCSVVKIVQPHSGSCKPTMHGVTGRLKNEGSARMLSCAAELLAGAPAQARNPVSAARRTFDCCGKTKWCSTDSGVCC